MKKFSVVTGLLLVLGSSAFAAVSEVVAEPMDTVDTMAVATDPNAEELAVIAELMKDPVVIQALEYVQGQNLNGKVFITGSKIQPMWRGRYRETTLILGLRIPGERNVSVLGRLEIRTFSDPALHTSAQFFTPDQQS